MDFKFSKGDDDQTSMEGGTPKKNQSALLVLLLILVGGFSYIYFFTGLINPQPEPVPVAPPEAQVIKNPLPPREGGTTPQKVGSAEAPKIAAVPAPPAPPAVAAKPASPAPVTPAPAKPVAVNPAPKSVAALPKAVAPKVSEKKETAPVKVGEQKKTEQKIAAGEQKQKVVAKPVEKKTNDSKKIVSEQGVKKPLGAVKKSAHENVSIKEDEKGSWTIQVGNYALEEALATDLVLVRKAGLTANVQPGVRKKTTMNRLQSAEFSDRESAQQEVARMKKHTSDAFVIDNGGKFVVYAGSYLLDSRAASEKDRLTSAGFKLTIRKVEVAIPTKLLTAGPFSSRKSAEEALNKLKKAGLKANIK